jgi:hypothetical protein
MAANINGTNIPTNINGRGHYQFTPPAVLARNGQGGVIVAEYSTIVWSFPKLSVADFTWWYTTMLGGAPSLIITSASLYNALGALTTYTAGVLLRPTWEGVTGYYYLNVTINIEDLL